MNKCVEEVVGLNMIHLVKVLSWLLQNAMRKLFGKSIFHQMALRTLSRNYHLDQHFEFIYLEYWQLELSKLIATYQIFSNKHSKVTNLMMLISWKEA